MTSLRRWLLIALFVVVPPARGAETPKNPRSPFPTYADGRGPTGPVELRIVAPKPDEVLPLADAAPGADGKASGPGTHGTDVHVRFELENFELFKDEKTGTGQHIDIVLDNLPYAALYDAEKAWVFKNVGKGTHTLRAFVSRPWFESIKEPGAFATLTFHVGEKSGENVPKPGEPLLTYSRPKGKYPRGQKVLLDFFVTGCRVSSEPAVDTCRVRYRIDDQPEVTLHAWEPVWLENVPVGKHAYVIGLTREGKLIPGPFNLARGFFEVEDTSAPKPAETSPKGPGPGGAPLNAPTKTTRG